ncbi:RING finger protein (Zin) [Metarhizium album ARSEF 1941]|uniref:RING finger protein (Zin) n=1 Tax=Metarhizium album (strain ARSEF 1941) TaxID=1081103 RepID=A0A0B2WNY7_METAS|nr:RING finger protein (Zin) [Metarhizium album ARSEF 1941]KHN95718.1 RING finger protein (Zin) [Metarhizium album ARSEF 1941]
MVFIGLLSSDKASADRPRPQETELLPEYIIDEAQLPCVPPERPNLRELNTSLEALAAVFPDIQIEVFRELLSNFDGESRLALVANALLKNRVDCVKGRWKVADKQQAAAAALPKSDMFRSQEYIQAARTLAAHEFRGLSRSTVNAVLAESNHSYLDARRTLVALSSKSWRFTIQSLLLRRKPLARGEAENHPLVVWRSTGQGSITPTIRTTENAELDRELYDALVRPLKQKMKDDREVKDRVLAVLLNQEEAEAASATHECACCFVDYSFEEFTSCSTHGHMICHNCVQNSIKEALFGQGWLSNINADTGTLRCLAVDSGGGCLGHISSDHIHRAFMQEKTGAEILHKLDQRLAELSLAASKVPLIHCPFCSYAEVDDIYLPSRQGRPRFNTRSILNLAVISVITGVSMVAYPFALAAALICLTVSVGLNVRRDIGGEWNKAVHRHCRRRRGLRFSCQNPGCGRASCLSCHKAWADIHVCHESSLVALRTQVEQAMSMAVKRVCPRCSTSFVKNAGCNKLTCPCGYKMCYVCRADLGDEGYRHFCDHFRPDGDPRACTQCDRCNLWESEDVDAVLRQAREVAEKKWRDSEKRDLSGVDVAYLETGVASRGANTTLDQLLTMGALPTLSDFLDLLVEAIYF